MSLVLAALAVLGAGAVGSLACGRRALPATLLGAGAAVAGAALGLVGAVRTLAEGTTATWQRPWDVPGGSLTLGLDGLSAWFLLPIFGLTAVAAVYGAAYLWPSRHDRALGPAWACYGALTASMAVVVLARNAVLFLVAWELMALASYFLVVFDDDDPRVREAGRTYLIATHLGTAFLLAMFGLLGRASGSLDFAAIAAGPAPSASLAGVLFLLGVVGFGTKAGFMPFHVWLPEAHPAAPSHVSAVMSGVMVKTGIYGLLRVLTLLPEARAWWGWVLIGIGVLSGVWGILHAVVQHDLKRLLAYSTVENVGIIALGLGIGLLGVAAHTPVIAVLGFAGALLHVANHALMKGALFLGAGAVAHAAGTRRLDELGGLAKRMPWLAGAVLVAAVAIVGLPPLNGFFGEFLIYLAALRDDATLPEHWSIPAVLLIAALGLIGGLAAIAFSKLFGIAFLGEPRTAAASRAHRPGPLLVGPAVALAAGCVLMALFAPAVVRVLVPLAATAAGQPAAGAAALAPDVLAPAGRIVLACGIGTAVFAGLAGLRFALLRGREVGRAGTWDCGYARPSATMQYTGSSLVGPVIQVFREMLDVRTTRRRPEGLFPAPGGVETRAADVCLDDVYRPGFRLGAALARRLGWIQQGTTHVYVLYITLTLVVLLVWQLGLR
jgi:formate hydrogenlyase subunit 3/multisubunit Na+/H+ antiporter MnhD subunit